MILAEQIRAGLNASDPADAFDQLVQQELRQGRTPQQVYDDIKSLMPNIVELPEFRGEAESDLHGIMDALRGWCHPSCRYVESKPEAIRRVTVDAQLAALPQRISES